MTITKRQKTFLKGFVFGVALGILFAIVVSAENLSVPGVIFAAITLPAKPGFFLSLLTFNSWGSFTNGEMTRLLVLTTVLNGLFYGFLFLGITWLLEKRKML